MMILVIGGSGSGKSAYAEELAVSLSKDSDYEMPVPMYYLAAMQLSDKEGYKKAARHRQLRKGKGFHTIEQQTDIHQAIEKMEGRKGTVLLECMSNLTANEMFSGEKQKSETETAEKIIQGIRVLNAYTAHFIIVSNNVFEDGVVYDETTAAYIRAMGSINRTLACMADWVAEVVAGIPVFIKQ